MKSSLVPSVVFAVVLLAGCASTYSWTSSVPREMRTVSVPTFRNESDVTEIGAIAARQLAREFQREGTFRIRSVGDAALEVQGVVKSVGSGITGYDRTTSMRVNAARATANVEVSVIDKRSGTVLIDNRMYVATASHTSTQDNTTGLRNISGLLMEDLAQQVVGDLLGMEWRKDGSK